MATGTGTAIIDFGSFPGANETSYTVTGLSGIDSTQSAEAWIMYETATGHSANDHAYAATLVKLTCGVPTTGTGFTIYARSLQKMQGEFTVRYAWA